nr:hypothetical protein GCM10020093_047270 [Planobispora longispora]
MGEPADVHAWAATVAFAATGRPTFGGGTAEAQMYAVLNGQADLAGVPAALLPLVRAALHREGAKRPTAALLAARLARLARAALTQQPQLTRAAGKNGARTVRKPAPAEPSTPKPAGARQPGAKTAKPAGEKTGPERAGSRRTGTKTENRAENEAKEAARRPSAAGTRTARTAPGGGRRTAPWPPRPCPPSRRDRCPRGTWR